MDNPFEEIFDTAADRALLRLIIRMLKHEHHERRKFQEKLMNILDQLKAEVASVRGIEDQVVVLLDKLKQLLDVALANGDQQGIKDVITALEDGKAELAAAITRDTPAPPVADPQTLATAVDTPLVIVLTGSDSDGSALTYAVVDFPSNGVLSSVDGPNVTYTPNVAFTGADSFTFKVTGIGGDSAPATIGITVG